MIRIDKISRVDMDIKPRERDITASDAVAIRTVEYDVTVRISGTQKYVAATWELLGYIGTPGMIGGWTADALRYDDGKLIITDPASGTTWTYRPIEVQGPHLVFEIVDDNANDPEAW